MRFLGVKLGLRKWPRTVHFILLIKTCISWKGNSTDCMEDDKMAARWILLEFFLQIPVEKQKEVPACHKCCAKLALTGELTHFFSFAIKGFIYKFILEIITGND